jgi:high affinity Mn2+ porin
MRQNSKAIATSGLPFAGRKWIMVLLTAGRVAGRAQDVPGTPAISTNAPAAPEGPSRIGMKPPAEASTATEEQLWNFHFQTTAIAQGDFGFPAKYSGPNSLNSKGEIQETVTADLFAGVRLWPGAEAHMDFLMWQGFGLSQTFGIEAFPNGDGYKAGTQTPNYTFARLFLRQTIGFGGEEETLTDGPLSLAGKQDISRLTITIGRMSPLDFVDNNRYAGNPHTQFMNWALMANATFDYGQDTVGFTTGIALDLNQPTWALRYTFFQMPRDKNGFTGDDQYLMYPTRGEYGPFLRTWSMAVEFEKRYYLRGHPGVVRFLAWLDEANFASYQAATAYLLANPPDPNAPAGSGGNIPDSARADRYKYGFGLNWEQEISKDVGVFSRLGWCDGQEETWTFTDVDYSASLGLSIKGQAWHRADDTFGLAGIISGASVANRKFLQAGGLDMLDGDSNLNYGWEKMLEAYYDFNLWKTIHLTADYQFVVNPAFNRDRGPVSILSARLHWEF